MLTLRITKFGGLAPRVSDENLPFTMARVANDVDLSRSTILGMRASKPMGPVPPGTGFLWRDGCCTLTNLDACASVARSFIPCERHVFSGFNTEDQLKAEPPFLQWTSQPCLVPRLRVGMPCALTAPTASAPPPVALAVGAVAREPRSYVYRLVNAAGDASAPSPATFVDADYSAPVALSGWPTADPEFYGLTEVVIYRTVAELTHGDKEDIDNSFYEIGRVPLGTATFVDTGLEVGDEMLEEYVDPPEPGLVEVQYAGNGVFAARKGNQVHFSAKGNLANWPQGERIVLDTTRPVRLLSGERASYVLTGDTHSIIAHVVDPSGCRAVITAPGRHPIVSYRSAVLFGDFVVFATQVGLVMMAPNGDARVLTSNYYNEDDWGALEPWTCVGAIRRGYYYGFFKSQTIRLRLPDRVYENAAQHELTTMSARATAATTTPDDELYYAEGVELKWLEGAAERLEAEWESAEWVLPGRTSLSAFLLKSDSDVKLTHRTQDRWLPSITVVGRMPRRIPLYSGREWAANFKTKGELTEYRVATSVQELSNVKS